MKKALALVMSIVMIVSCMSLGVFAASADLKVSAPASAEEGEKVSASISISGEEVYGVEFDVVAPEGATVTAVVGQYKTSYAYAASEAISGKLVTIEFAAEAGDVEVGAENVVFFDKMGEEIDGGKVVSTVKVEKAPCKHVWGEWVIVKEATETEKGLKERTCTLCGAKESQEIPMVKPVAPEVKGDYVVVIAKAGENGEISPEGMIKVKVGGKEIFDIKANDGYVIEKLTVGGKEVTKAAGEAKYNLTVSNIVENMTVEATFAVASEAKLAPSTGANDFVGVAVALAVVSAMGAAVISKR